MFTTRHASPTETVTIYLDGEAIEAPRGETLAAVLLARGLIATGTTPVSGSPRGPYCMIGTCFGCLIEVAGRGDLRACLTPAIEGLRVRRRTGPRDPLA
jgi:predicted molibdopterin-dependent oxidoreductase YjgC